MNITNHQCFQTERVLERGEKIELLVDKTDKLNQQAFKFEKQSKQLKNAMWWKNVKMMAIIGLIVCVRWRCRPTDMWDSAHSFFFVVAGANLRIVSSGCNFFHRSNGVWWPCIPLVQRQQE